MASCQSRKDNYKLEYRNVYSSKFSNGTQKSTKLIGVHLFLSKASKSNTHNDDSLRTSGTVTSLNKKFID